MKIDKEIIKLLIVGLPGKLKNIFKKVYGMPHSGKYLFLSFVFFIIFLIITFPYDSILRKKIYSLEGTIFRSIDMGGFEFSILSETYINNINIVLLNNNEISCKNSIINLSLNPYNLLLRRKLEADFQFDSLRYSGKDYSLIFNINGNVNIEFDKIKNIPINGPVKVILSDSVIKLHNLSIPGPMGPFTLKVESVNIQNGNIDALITNGNLRFNNFKISGPDLSCGISGNIDLGNNSKLDLVISVDSESTVLDQYKDLLNSFIKNNELSVRIKGNISKPELTLYNPEKNEN